MMRAAMGTVTLLLGIHNHQPQGNFEHVFAQGYEDCYGRLLDAIERHPGVRISLHYSGPLIEWLEEHHPDYFDRLAALVKSRQVEMMGAGFYEPMLSVLSDRDARGQLQMMADFLEGRVGARPTGMWLAERVWEPDLARTIASAGYRYTIVDDGHFLAVGMKRPLRGYYLTEKGGLPLCLFPISMELRYTIPWKPAPEAIDALHRIADEAGDGDLVVTYGDDGEKFGMWPETKKWVWDEGWLEQFFTLLEKNTDRIRTSTFAEELGHHPPSGRAYLPTASYDEMGEWSLPAEAQRRLHEVRGAVEGQGHKEDWGPFVRGGIWQGFMAKYPEVNFMHKRMCHVSDRVARAAANLSASSDPAARKGVEMATRELYRGQCNCAYWHGLFGGLYLGKLRSAVHTHLIRADVEASRLLEAPALETVRADLDADLADEVILSGRSLGVMVAPARGGALFAIDDRKRCFCVTDVLSRRPEAYHSKVLELAGKSTTGSPASGDAPAVVGAVTHVKDARLAEILVYDPHQRLAFVDQFFPAELELDDLRRCRATELGTFKTSAYDLVELQRGTGRLTLRRVGRVRGPAGVVEVTLQKTISLEGGELDVEYELSPGSVLRGVYFASEISLALPSGPAPSGQCRISSRDGAHQDHVATAGSAPEVSRVELHDSSSELTIALTPSPAALMVRFPLETVSQSESGIERTYQGTTLVFLWRCELGAGESLRPALRLHVS